MSTNEDESDPEFVPQSLARSCRVKIPSVIREVDRYCVSKRAAAAIVNATLKDYATELGISENDVNRSSIDGSKIQWERERIGVVAEKEHEKKSAQIEVIGFDGKQCDTKV